jgi:aminoglycoside 6'-N-acetyltransferase
LSATNSPPLDDNAQVTPEAPVHVVVHDGNRELSGVAHAGESWAVAARRTVASMHVDPFPLDLSDEVKHFGIDRDTRVALRAMSRGDLADLLRWRQSEHVVKWWVRDGTPTTEEIEAKYGPRIDGMAPTRMWVAEVNGRSVGFVQDYVIADYPDYALPCPDPRAIGVDYAIGEEEWTGRGLGSRIVWAWMLRARRRFPEAASYFAAPDHRNHASLRVLAKVGFAEGVWFDQAGDDETATYVGCTLDVATVLG